MQGQAQVFSLTHYIRLLWMMFLSCVCLTACQLPKNQALSSEESLPKLSLSKQSTAEVLQNYNVWLDADNYQNNVAQGLTGYYALDNSFLSLASRIHMIRHAKYQIDVQYYIWADDEIGHILLAELLNAAERGVQVRLIIDDQNGTDLDQTLIALSQHPNFQIKLYNPYKYRYFRVADYLLRAKQINRRMHNKLLIADGFVALTGGRNVSNEYFEASQDFQFSDMDVMFVGTAVTQASQVFANFWTDELSYPVAQMIEKPADHALETQRKHYQQFLSSQRSSARLQKVEEMIRQYGQGRQYEWTEAHFVGDLPSKTKGNGKDDDLIANQISHLIATPKQRISIVSAYFVPQKAGTANLTAQSKAGVKSTILTNSLVANDVAMVHAFYQKYRRDLVESGVKLYEFKPYIHRKEKSWYEVLTGNVLPAKSRDRSSLHAKFFLSDDQVFIGSFNCDPRSMNLNTEVGLVIRSANLANAIETQLEQYLPYIAYQVQLDDQGQLIWLERFENGQSKIHHQEPQTTAFQRGLVKIISWLPIESMM